MTNLDGLTLAEINEQIELLEVAERFGTKLQEFTDWLSTFAGGEAGDWVSDDPTVQFVLTQQRTRDLALSTTYVGTTASALAEPSRVDRPRVDFV